MYLRPIKLYRQAVEMLLSHECYSLHRNVSDTYTPSSLHCCTVPHQSPTGLEGLSFYEFSIAAVMSSSIEHNISLSTQLHHNLQSSKTLATSHPHPCRRIPGVLQFIHSMKHIIIIPPSTMDTSIAQQASTLEGAAQDLHVARIESYVCEQVRRECACEKACLFVQDL